MTIVNDLTCSGRQKPLFFAPRGNYGPALRVCTCDLMGTCVDTGAYGPMCTLWRRCPTVHRTHLNITIYFNDNRDRN